MQFWTNIFTAMMYTGLIQIRHGAVFFTKQIRRSDSSGRRKSGSSEYWCQQGKNNVIYAYSKNPYAEDKVDVILMDHSGNLGHTYYYKVVTEGVVYGSQISSNVVSAQTKLEIPDLVKCCTTDGKTVKLKWYPCEKAQGYQIYRKDSRKLEKNKDH